MDFYVSGHARERLQERGMSTEDISLALSQPSTTMENSKRGSKTYIGPTDETGRAAQVVVSWPPEQGDQVLLITAMWRRTT